MHDGREGQARADLVRQAIGDDGRCGIRGACDRVDQIRNVDDAEELGAGIAEDVARIEVARRDIVGLRSADRAEFRDRPETVRFGVTTPPDCLPLKPTGSGVPVFWANTSPGPMRP